MIEAVIVNKNALKSAFVVAAFSMPVVAYSLYDAAPMIGLLESASATYSASVNVGYDSNPACLTDGKESGSMYANAALSTSFADIESVNKLVYSASLGATYYFGEGDYSGRRWYGDCSASLRFTHAFSSRSQYTTNISLSYQPEADYANGVSSAHRQGDVFSWSVNNMYKESIDARWSWSVNGSVRGVQYAESTYSYDDRYYLSGGLSLYYRASSLMTYVLSASYQYELRDKGYNSQSVFVNAGFDRSLDPYSSISFRVGAQLKYVEEDSFVNPTINVAYNRRVTSGLSMRFFVAYRDENVDTYRGGLNYYSSPSWRAGVTGTYRLSPIVAFNFGVSYIYTTYEKGELGLADEHRTAWQPYVGMDYTLSKQAVANITLRYYYSETEYSSHSSDYNRWNISAGLRYRF